MANEEQLAILHQGVKVWNEWREENPNTAIDLVGASLPRTNLNEVNLSKANLANANLVNASLEEADLSESDLTLANLSLAKLSGAVLGYALLQGTELNEANLLNANLTEANFLETDLIGTCLIDAILQSAILRDVDLSYANVNHATLGNTILAGIDLSRIYDLHGADHLSPSHVDVETIQLSKGKIPEVFLRGSGLSDADIEYAKLYNPDLSNDEKSKILYRIYDIKATQALQISPLFISYSHGDGTFVDTLESHLNKKGIRFWRDVHDMKSGKIETQIDRAMRLNPTVLLVLSGNSLKSDWVEHEVRTARDLEKEMGRDILCPVALDESWKDSPWPKRVMEQVMEYNILDFSDWQDDSQFGSTFNKLIDGLELFYKG